MQCIVSEHQGKNIMARTQRGIAWAATAVVLMLGEQHALAAEPAQAASVQEAGASLTEWPSPWQLRLRGLGVITRDSGYVDGVSGSGLSYSNTVTPELDILFFYEQHRSRAHTRHDLCQHRRPRNDRRAAQFRQRLAAAAHTRSGQRRCCQDKNTFGTALQVGFDYGGSALGRQLRREEAFPQARLRRHGRRREADREGQARSVLIQDHFECLCYVEALNELHATFTTLILATKDCGRRSASATLAYDALVLARRYQLFRQPAGESDFGISGCSCLFRSRIEQCCRLYLEHRCELLDHVDAGSINATLKSADVGSIDTSFMRQRLLRKLLFLAKLAEIAGKDLSDSHAREATLLLRISPQSILYKHGAPA